MEIDRTCGPVSEGGSSVCLQTPLAATLDGRRPRAVLERCRTGLGNGTGPVRRFATTFVDFRLPGVASILNDEPLTCAGSTFKTRLASRCHFAHATPCGLLGGQPFFRARVSLASRLATKLIG